jgi:hypothetical protein
MIADAATALDVAGLRQEDSPTAEATHLNSASIGPLPERTRLALEAFNRNARRRTSRRPRVLRGVRRVACAGGQAQRESAEIALAFNTSYGLNLAGGCRSRGRRDRGQRPGIPGQCLSSPGSGPGVRLELVPVTAEGWPDEQRLLDRMSDSRGAHHRRLPCSPATGTRWTSPGCPPGAETDTFLVVDAIQGLGGAGGCPGDPVDILSCGAQKWLLGPWGSGLRMCAATSSLRSTRS